MNTEPEADGDRRITERWDLARQEERAERAVQVAQDFERDARLATLLEAATESDRPR